MTKTPFTSFMHLALEQAEIAARCGEVPVGAVIIHGPSHRVLAATYNLVETRKDPTAHAEMLAIRAAAHHLNTARLSDCDLYVTLEPCGMCATAISHARIRRLYYGAADEKGGGVHHGARIFQQSTCHHRPEVYSGLQSETAEKLLKDFFRIRRK